MSVTRTQLVSNVIGVSTFPSSPVIIGSGTSTGTASQPLQVTGGAYVSGNLGIGTTNPLVPLSVVGGVSFTQLNVSGVSTLGITSTTDLRVSSLADKTTIISGNTASLIYNTGGGNVAICTNPSGPITLSITGIPTDSSFDNRSISFAVIVQQGATAYACTNVTLNGVAFGASVSAGLQTGISYSGGTVATGNTTAYDVFNFTGINTVGSASTILNYKILSNVSGNYKRY